MYEGIYKGIFGTAGKISAYNTANSKEYSYKNQEDNVKCYVDDVLHVDYTHGVSAKADAYQVVSTDETGDIIVKPVNVTGDDKTLYTALCAIKSLTLLRLIRGFILQDTIA